MPANYLSNPIIFLISTVVGAYIFILILRVLLQYTSADSSNPLSSLIIKATQAPLRLLKPVFPTIRGINLSAVALMLLLQMLLGVVISLGQGGLNVGSVFVWSLAELLSTVINVFIYSIFITVILSWINPNVYNPMVNLLYKITEPVLKPFQRLIPPIGGLDLSPIAALLALQVLKMLLIPPLLALL